MHVDFFFFYGQECNCNLQESSGMKCLSKKVQLDQVTVSGKYGDHLYILPFSILAIILHILKSNWHMHEHCYTGLPASPPSNPRASMGFGPNQQYPLTADVPTTKSEKLKTGIIVVIAVSSFALVLACFGVVLLLLKWRKLRRPSTAISPAITPSLTKRSGN